jgi:hypothetical protein
MRVPGVPWKFGGGTCNPEWCQSLEFWNGTLESWNEWLGLLLSLFGLQHMIQIKRGGHWKVNQWNWNPLFEIVSSAWFFQNSSTIACCDPLWHFCVERNPSIIMENDNISRSTKLPLHIRSSGLRDDTGEELIAARQGRLKLHFLFGMARSNAEFSRYCFAANHWQTD